MALPWSSLAVPSGSMTAICALRQAEATSAPVCATGSIFQGLFRDLRSWNIALYLKFIRATAGAYLAENLSVLTRHRFGLQPVAAAEELGVDEERMQLMQTDQFPPTGIELRCFGV